MITFMWIIQVELKFSGIKEGDYLDMIGFVGLPPATVFAFMCGQSFSFWVGWNAFIFYAEILILVAA